MITFGTVNIKLWSNYVRFWFNVQTDFLLIGFNWNCQSYYEPKLIKNVQNWTEAVHFSHLTVDQNKFYDIYLCITFFDKYYKTIANFTVKNDLKAWNIRMIMMCCFRVSIVQSEKNWIFKFSLINIHWSFSSRQTFKFDVTFDKQAEPLCQILKLCLNLNRGS
jgi:hypothetical protein